MEEAVRKLLDAAIKEIAASGDDLQGVDLLRIRYLGRKGELTQLFKELGKVSEMDRPAAGKLLNEVKVELENRLSAAVEAAKAEAARRSRAV